MVDVTTFVYRSRNLTGPQWLRFRKVDLNDPSSRAGVIHALKHLHYNDYVFEPKDLGDWASSHGWKTTDVAVLVTFATGILAGQRYHTPLDPFGYHAIDEWRKAAGVNG